MTTTTIGAPADTGRRSGTVTVKLVSELYLAAYFLFISGAVDSFFYHGYGAGGFENRSGSNALIQLVAITAAAPALLMCVIRSRASLAVLRRSWPYLLLLGFAGASILWSVVPSVSVRRFVALALNLPIALYFAITLRERSILAATGIVAAVICLACVPAALMLGSVKVLATARHGAALSGVFPTKTASGVFFGIATILLWGNYANARPRTYARLAWLCLTALAFVELILSQSRTPLLATVLAGCVTWLALFVFAPRGWQRRLQASLRSGIAGLIVAGAAILGPISITVVLLLIGRDLTLTGRLNLWTYAIGKGWHQPWLGAGIKAFWTDTLTLDLVVLHAHWSAGQATEAMTSNAHNGYLDVWLELGFFGLALFAVFWFSFLFKAVRRIARDGIASAWSLGIWTFMTGYYVANSTVFEHDEISWFMAVFCFVALCAAEAGYPAGSRTTASPARGRRREPAAVMAY